MLTISLQGIQLHAKVGLYPQEKITGNNFEIDVDVFVNTEENKELPFIDYAVIHKIVVETFLRKGELLETFVKEIHIEIKKNFAEADKVKVAIRKMSPPLQGAVNFAQVCYEN